VVVEPAPGRIVGNRLALAGTVLYFLEWVGIALAPSLPTTRYGADAAATLVDYADRSGATAFLAGWLALVLPGRILFTVGLRSSLRELPRARPLALWAVGAMTASVALEVGCYSLVAGAARAADHGADSGAVAVMDSAAAMMFVVVLILVGVAMLGGGLAMLLSRGFPSWLSWLGVVGGALVAGTGPVVSAAAGADGGLADLGDALQATTFLFWVWMIGTSVVLFRRTRADDRLAAGA
jgi:hypothetical protein